MAPPTDTRATYFRDLYEIVCDRNASLDTKIERAIETGRLRLDAANGHLTYTGDGAYEIIDTNMETGDYTPGSITELDTTWCRHVVANRELVAFADVEQSSYSDDIAKDATGLQCYIGAPLVVDGETYGTLCYSDSTPRDREFSEDDQQFIQLLAEWISHELEREKHHRELRAQNERLDEFTGIVAHDLRNPLAGAMAYMELLRDELDTDSQAAEFARTVSDSLDRMESMIEGLLLLAKQGADVGRRESVALADLARDAWNTVNTREASLTVATNQVISADRARLRQLFENLFRNAVEHGGRDVNVRVEALDRGFAVEDDGSGISEEILEGLFHPDTVAEEQGGLGLLIVERIVNGHGWGITVQSGDDGTRFEITGVVPAPEQVPEGATA